MNVLPLVSQFETEVLTNPAIILEGGVPPSKIIVGLVNTSISN